MSDQMSRRGFMGAAATGAFALAGVALAGCSSTSASSEKSSEKEKAVKRSSSSRASARATTTRATSPSAPSKTLSARSTGRTTTSAALHRADHHRQAEEARRHHDRQYDRGARPLRGRRREGNCRAADASHGWPGIRRRERRARQVRRQVRQDLARDPLLTSDDDYKKVAAAINENMASFDDGKTALCLMGHGTEADSNADYARCRKCSRTRA